MHRTQAQTLRTVGSFGWTPKKSALLCLLFAGTIYGQTARLSQIDTPNGTVLVEGGAVIEGTELVQENSLATTIFSVVPTASSGLTPILTITGGGMAISAEKYQIWPGANITPYRDNLYSLGGTAQGIPPSNNRWANVATVQLNSDTWPTADLIGFLKNDGTGILSWSGSASGCPAGNSWQIQYFNSASTCGASNQLIWFGTDGTLDIVNGPNLGVPALSIKETGGNATARIMAISNAANTEVFGVNGAGASLFPNYIFSNGMVPYTDNTASLGAGNAGWSQTFSHNTYVENVNFCQTSVNFVSVDCWDVNGDDGTLRIFQPSGLQGIYQMAAFTPYNGPSSTYGLFMFGEVSPENSGEWNLGEVGRWWNNAYIGELFNLGNTTSINTVTYTWPSANGTGVLRNNGLGTLTWGSAPPCGSNSMIQYNNAGACGADANLEWNSVGQIMNLSGEAILTAATGNPTALVLTNAPGGACSSGNGVFQVLDPNSSPQTVFQVLCASDPSNPNAVISHSHYPGLSGTYDLGAPASAWRHAYIQALTNTSQFMSIGGVNYAWPLADATGVLKNDGAGNLSWLASADVTSLNGLAGAVTIAGTGNEINVTPSGNTLILSTPQGICTACAVTFSSVTANGLTSSNGLTLPVGTFVNGSAQVFSSSISNTNQITTNTLTASSSLAVGTFSSVFSVNSAGAIAGSSLALTGSGTFANGQVGVGSSGVAIGGGLNYFANGLTGQSVTLNMNAVTCFVTVTSGIITGHSGC